MDIKYIKFLNLNFSSYLFSGVKSRAKTFGGIFFYPYIRINYLIKALASYLLKIPYKSKEYYDGVEVIILGTHFIEEYLNIEKSRNILLIGSINEYNASLKYKFNFFDASGIYRAVALMSWSGRKSSTKLFDELLRLKCYLKIYSSTLKVIYINADLLPFYRAVLSIFSDSQVKIICPQHGLYTTKVQFGEIEGGLADINYVFDDHQKQVLINCGVSESSIIVNDFKPKQFFSFNKSNKNDVIIVSEGWHVNLGPKVVFYYISIVRLYLLIRKCDKNPIIRLHPSERKFKYFLFFIDLDTRSLAESLKEFNYFVGYSSSLLKEAKDAGKISIQLPQNFYKNIVNMQDLGYASFSFDIKEFVRYLKNI